MNGISLCLFGVGEEIMGQSIGMILGSLRKEKASQTIYRASKGADIMDSLETGEKFAAFAERSIKSYRKCNCTDNAR